MKIIDNYVDGRIMERLEELSTRNDLSLNIRQDEWYRSRERLIQYKGDTEEIYRFYKMYLSRTTNYINLNNFYRRAGNSTMPLLHFSLASIITKSMANLLFSADPKITVTTGNELKDINLNKVVEDIYKENDQSDLLQRAAEMESYSGAVAFKIVLDDEESDFPIIQIKPKEEVEVIRKYDRVSSIIFKDKYCDGDLVLYSIYGRGYIDYKLYKHKTDGNDLIEVPLTTLDETSKLKKINIFNKDGSKSKLIFAIYKENKTNGESDYNNLMDDFAALDETYSNNINFIRTTKPKEYFPESLCEVNTQTNETNVPQDYDTEKVILHDSDPNIANMNRLKVDRDIPDGSAQLMAYSDAFNALLLKALATAGLSPATIGWDTAGANSSALALNIRERVSMRTRSEKLNRWSEALEKLTKILFLFYTAKFSNESMYIEEDDVDVAVEFSEYESPSFDQKVTSLAEALNNNLIDLRSALEQLYPEKNEEDIDEMILNISGQLPGEEEVVEKEMDEDDEDPEQPEEEPVNEDAETDKDKLVK